MNQDLHDTLHQASDLVGPVAFDPDDLWRQAMRKKHRRAGLTTLSLLLVAALGSFGIWWGTTSPRAGSVPPATSPQLPAMPSHVYGVPDRASAESGTLAIGTTAVAFVTQRGLPVAVSAIDGSYHLLDLPGLVPDPIFRTTPPAVAVSPGGTRLAYGWMDPLPQVSGRHVRSGVRVLDTRTGQVSSYPVPGGLGAECGELSWSANERFLAYSCQIDSVLDARSSSGSLRTELLDLRTGVRRTVPQGFVSSGHIAVAVDGTVAAAGMGYIDVWRPAPAGARSNLVSVLHAPHSAAWLHSPDLIAAGSGSRSDLQIVSVGSGKGSGSRTLALSGDASVVGTVAENEVAVLVVSGTHGTLSLLKATASAPRPVVVVEGVADADQYSFATDLLRGPTRDTAAPRWPTDWAAWAGRGGLALVGLLVVAIVVVALRRRRGRRLMLPA